MIPDLDGRHAKQVDSWIARSVDGRSASETIRVYGLAIVAIQNRTLLTLSDVTLNAVVDRVHRVSETKFPLLSSVRIESSEISFADLIARSEEFEIEEINSAFRFFLIELLTIIENLTAGILMKPLYNELLKVDLNTDAGTAKIGSRNE